MTELAQRLRFDLTDPLAGDVERAAHLFEGVLRALTEAGQPGQPKIGNLVAGKTHEPGTGDVHSDRIPTYGQ